MALHWEGESVRDDELAAEFIVVEDNGKLALFMRDSAIDAHPGRVAVQVMAALRMWDEHPFGGTGAAA